MGLFCSCKNCFLIHNHNVSFYHSIKTCSQWGGAWLTCDCQTYISPLISLQVSFFFIIKINMDFVTKESIPLCELYICIFWMSCLYFYSGLTEANRFKWADTSLGGGLSSSGHHHMWLLITVYSLCFTVIKPHLRFHLNAWHFRFCIITDYFESKTIGTLSSISPRRRKVLIRVSWMHHLSDPPASLLWSRH